MGIDRGRLKGDGSLKAYGPARRLSIGRGRRCEFWRKCDVAWYKITRQSQATPDSVHLRHPEMAKKFPLLPKNPERICWGCDKYCPSDSLACGNGADRTQHPVELFGEDWADWGLDAQQTADEAEQAGLEKAEK
jgi:hypothetical protein